jgi:hypothetical protein
MWLLSLIREFPPIAKTVRGDIIVQTPSNHNPLHLPLFRRSFSAKLFRTAYPLPL